VIERESSDERLPSVRLTRRQMLRTSGLGLLAVGLAACGGAAAPGSSTASSPKAGAATGSAAGSPASGAPKPAGELPLVRMPYAKGGDMDIGTSSDSMGIDLAYNAFEGLTTRDKDASTIKPGVAEKWDVADDKLTWTFHLRKDARFSDGTPVTAQTFVDSWRRVADPKTASHYAGTMYFIKGFREANTGQGSLDGVAVKAVDDYTFQTVTNAPAAFMTILLATEWVSFPQPMHIISSAGKQWINDPKTLVSNGPFKVASIKPDQEVVLEPNPYYWGPKPQVRVGWEELNSAKYGFPEAMSAYEAGQLDMAFVPFTDLDRVKNDPNLSKQLSSKPNSYVWWVNLDTTNPPFTDKRVRQALYLAVDREKLTKEVLKGAFEPAYTVLPPEVKIGYTADARIKGTVDDARKLLADAGFPNSKGMRELELTGYSDQVDRKAIYQALQAMWKESLGLNIRLNLLETKTTQDFRLSHQKQPYDMLDGGWLPDFDDPYNWLNFLFSAETDRNWPKYRSNKEFNDLITQGAGEQDVQKRTDLYQKAHNIITNDVPVVPYAKVIDWEVRKPSLQNLVVTSEMRNYLLAWTTSTGQK
jgi:oligopeptide transport system substrate-binding protein